MNSSFVRFSRPAIPVLAALVLAGCGASGASGADASTTTEDALGTTYGDLFSTLDGADYERWANARQALVRGFDNICGDTFCEGDFSNITSLRVTCSSTAKRKDMRECAWVLGASLEHVNASTGEITTDARVLTCPVPVASTARRFLDALERAGDRAIDAKLPGTQGSFYDALGTCFEDLAANPIPDAPPGSFVAISEYLQGEAWTAWHGTTRALAKNFDDVCGDTFCEGDFPDIALLGFACATDAASGHVTECAASFARTYADIGARGKITAVNESKLCKVAVDADANALAAALAGDEPLRATLPGKTTSIYDALVGCL